jgi:hypothetical protein
MRASSSKSLSSSSSRLKSGAVLRDVTNTHNNAFRNENHDSKSTMSILDNFIPAVTVTVESAASQLLELAPREYTGVAIFESQLVFICRDPSCKGGGDTAYDITKQEHVESHAIGSEHKALLKAWRDKVLQLLKDWKLKYKGPNDLIDSFFGSNRRGSISVNLSFCRPQEIVFCLKSECLGWTSKRAVKPHKKCKKCGDPNLESGFGQCLRPSDTKARWWLIEEGGLEVWNTLHHQHRQTEQNAIKVAMLNRTRTQKAAADTGSSNPLKLPPSIDPATWDSWLKETGWSIIFHPENIRELVTTAKASMNKDERPIFLPVQEGLYSIFGKAKDLVMQTYCATASMEMLKSLSRDYLSGKSFRLPSDSTHVRYVREAWRRTLFFSLRLRNAPDVPFSDDLRCKLNNIWDLAAKVGLERELNNEKEEGGGEEDKCEDNSNDNDDSEDSEDSDYDSDDDSDEEESLADFDEDLLRAESDDEMYYGTQKDRLWTEFDWEIGETFPEISTDVEALEAALNEVSMMLITEAHRPDKPFTLRFLANILGFEITDDYENWRTPGEYSRYLPGFLYCIRLLIYTRSRPTDNRSPGPVERLKQLTVYTTNGLGIATSFSDITRLLAKAKELGRTERGRTTVQFAGDGEGRILEIYYQHKQTHSISVPAIKTMVNALLEEAMILGSLVAHCTMEDIYELLLTAVVDCPIEPRESMSFVETNPHLANGKERMAERWRKQRGCSPLDSGITDKYIWEGMRQRFLRVLFLLCYFTSGQPFRLSEGLCMTLYRVGPGRGRNDFQVHRGRMTLVMKVIKGGGPNFYVARFAPELVGKLLLLYLSEIRPFRADEDVFPHDLISPLHENLVWEEKGKPWTDRSIRKSFKEPTLKHLGVALPSRLCRQMMSGIGKDIRDTAIPTQLNSRGALEDAWELQCGHSSRTGQLHYGILKDTCLQVSAALFDGFLGISLTLQKKFFNYDEHMFKGYQLKLPLANISDYVRDYWLSALIIKWYSEREIWSERQIHLLALSRIESEIICLESYKGSQLLLEFRFPVH